MFISTFPSLPTLILVISPFGYMPIYCFFSRGLTRYCMQILFVTLNSFIIPTFTQTAAIVNLDVVQHSCFSGLQRVLSKGDEIIHTTHNTQVYKILKPNCHVHRVLLASTVFQKKKLSTAIVKKRALRSDLQE